MSRTDGSLDAFLRARFRARREAAEREAAAAARKAAETPPDVPVIWTYYIGGAPAQTDDIIFADLRER